MAKCKICGKDLKNPNSKSHINSKYHQDKLNKIPTDNKSITGVTKDIKLVEQIELINKKLKVYDSRLENLENILLKNKKSLIKTKNELFDIIKQILPVISNQVLGIATIEDLLKRIKIDYDISEVGFRKGLLKLNSENKIQLEPGMSDISYSLKDNYGNIYKLIRLL